MAELHKPSAKRNGWGTKYPWAAMIGPHEVGRAKTEDAALATAIAAIEGFAPKALDGAGRCCGRKPIVYAGHHFCHVCNAKFVGGAQSPNWAYELGSDGLFRYRSRFVHPRYHAGREALRNSTGGSDA